MIVNRNLGIGLAQEGKRVLLIDADAQASLTLALEYLRPDENSISKEVGILHHNERVDLLPFNIGLSGMEIYLINIMRRENILRTYVNIKVGSSLIPFPNKFPKNTKLYTLMTAKPGESA